jgi:uncharacterized protein
METTISVNLGQVARDLGLPTEKVERTVELLDDGNTVPFITRYRRDQTGGLDEEQIRGIKDKVGKLRMLAERKRTILKSVESQGKLTPELAEQIKSAGSTKRLEDVYLPYKPRKQTLATIARQRGLSPLARELLEADPAAADLEKRAADFVSPDNHLHSVAEVLLGVGHVLAERFSEQAELRGRLRKIVRRTGKLVSTKAGGAAKSEKAESPAETSPEPSEPKAAETAAPHEDAAAAAAPTPSDDGPAATTTVVAEPPAADAAQNETAEGPVQTNFVGRARRDTCRRNRRARGRIAPRSPRRSRYTGARNPPEGARAS